MKFRRKKIGCDTAIEYDEPFFIVTSSPAPERLKDCPTYLDAKTARNLVEYIERVEVKLAERGEVKGKTATKAQRVAEGMEEETGPSRGPGW
jgi:hypothetical protein